MELKECNFLTSMQLNTMTDAQAESFLKEVTALQSATDKLIVTYSNKIK